MTNNIGTVPIGSIQDISVSNGAENDEIEVVDEDSNLLVVGDDEGQDLSVECVLTKETHPDGLDVEDQRDDVKELVPKDALKSDFVYKEYEGWVVVDSVSVPENSDTRNLREAEISGRFLPWPKHHPEEGPPKNYDFLTTEVTIDVNWAGDIDLSRVWGMDASGSFGYAFGIDFNREWKTIAINLFMQGDLEIQ